MSIKSLVFHIVQRASRDANTCLVRSHAYELVASAFGYQTYAALSKNSVWVFNSRLIHDFKIDGIISRSLSLGYSSDVAADIASLVKKAINENKLHPIPVIELIGRINRGSYNDYDAHLTQCLEAQSADNGLIHYAVGKLLALEFHSELPPDSYWFKQRQNGKFLDEIQNEFANDYLSFLERRMRAKQFFMNSLNYGCNLGLLGLAEYFEDPGFFQKEIPADDLPLGTYEPLEIALMAHNMGFSSQYARWLLIACGHGDIDAIRTTVEHLNNQNPLLSHALAELSFLLGEDIREVSTCAVDEFGTQTDEDHGPIYAGGFDSVDLPQISKDDVIRSKSLAAAWFREIQQTGYSLCSF